MQHTHRQPARCAGTRPPLGEEVTGEKRVTSEGSPEPGARRARCPHPAAQTAPGTGVSEPGPRHGGPLGSASRSGAEGSAPTRYPAAPCLIARRFLPKRKPYRINRPFIWKYLTFLFFFFFFPPRKHLNSGHNYCEWLPGQDVRSRKGVFGKLLGKLFSYFGPSFTFL